MQEIKLILTRLDAAGIVYCIVGGLAAIIYGRPRLTLDVDLLVALDPTQVGSLISAFPEEDFYLPPEEVLLAESMRDQRGHFNIIHQHSALRADCYLSGKSDLAMWELTHRRKLTGPFGEVWIAPPEAVIANKLLFYREGGSAKHLEDIRAMLAAKCMDDLDILMRWIERLELSKEWNKI